MEEDDPLEHLEWDLISKDDLIGHIADLMESITWYDNCFYPADINLATAIEMRIMGLGWSEERMFSFVRKLV